MKLWDWALDYGVKGMKACQLTLRIWLHLAPLAKPAIFVTPHWMTKSFLSMLWIKSLPSGTILLVPELSDGIGSENLFTYSIILFLKF